MALPIPEVLLLIRSRFFWKLAVEKKHALFQALLNRYLSDSTALSENITLVCPDSEEYGKALALSGYVITDGPLPY